VRVWAILPGEVADQAAARGVSPSLAREVVRNGARSAGKKGTLVIAPESGKNRTRVVVDNTSGSIITVTKG